MSLFSSCQNAKRTISSSFSRKLSRIFLGIVIPPLFFILMISTGCFGKLLFFSVSNSDSILGSIFVFIDTDSSLDSISGFSVSNSDSVLGSIFVFIDTDSSLDSSFSPIDILLFFSLKYLYSSQLGGTRS